MDAIKNKFEKLSGIEFRCKVRMKEQDDNGQVNAKACNSIMVVGKNSMWNLKRHLIRHHEEVMKQIEANEQGNYSEYWLVVVMDIMHIRTSVNNSVSTKQLFQPVLSK